MTEQDILKKIINSFNNIRIAVIGDLILDVYLWGDASKISQEAPVPVLRVNRRTERLGGAANVMCNITTLGGLAYAFGVLGDDENASALEKLLDAYKINRNGVLRDKSRITTEKQRVIAASQQLLRIDHEVTNEISSSMKESLLRSIKKAIANKEIDAIIFEDYAKGVLDSSLASEITALAVDAGITVGIDPHPEHPLNISGITLMTPNKSEAFGLAGIYQYPVDSPEEEFELLKKVAFNIQKKWNPKYLLITLGAKGMALFEENSEPIVIPTKAREVFDVSGAGDTVIAAFSLALLAGAKPMEAVEIANMAAGIVVGKVGTVSVEKDELLNFSI
jgi:D-beta-D-heptose 7-phosphate kinase/D-beta-D-heptose 1-phosphate adenosyltransferase